MLAQVLMPIIDLIERTISAAGPWGVTILMSVEACNIPLPSEAIMPFAGYLVTKGVMSVHAAAFAGALGNVIGSIPSYYLGYCGGRPFVEKYGKWFLISKKDLEQADKWSSKFGDWAFFICRLLPIVRTFISLPAGILRANFPKFIIFTFIGSLIWCYGLTYIGIKFGENIEIFSKIWHKFDILIVVVGILLFGWYLQHHFKNLKES